MVDRDLKYIILALESFQDYLLSAEVYYPLSASLSYGQKPYPQLTLGNVLLAKKIIDGRERSGISYSPRKRRTQVKLENLKQLWRSAWEAKAEQELGSRLTLWSNFLNEYIEEPDEHRDRYTYEVNRRVLIELLRDEIGKSVQEVDQLILILDLKLKGNIIRSSFIWENNLISEFPEDRYWFLYSHLK